MWSQTGCEVTLLIRKDRVLSGWDRRTGMTLTRELKRAGVNVVTRSHVTAVDTGMNLGATVHYTREGEEGERQAYAQLVLAAVGRDPVTDFDWLAAAGVALDDRSFVVTDPRGAHVGAGCLGGGRYHRRSRAGAPRVRTGHCGG